MYKPPEMDFSGYTVVQLRGIIKCYATEISQRNAGVVDPDFKHCTNSFLECLNIQMLTELSNRPESVC
jgi:hypothetical protein